VARLFADENFPFPAVEALRTLGHDVVTVEEVGRSGQRWPDADVLEYARTEGRVVLTLNRKDFLALHRRNQEHSGMILCTLDLDFVGQAKRIADVIAEGDDFKGRVFRVYRPAR
jgi:predicted nuclease of predicted toxin-antitoxin system